MSTRRVAITGVGVVSPLGVGAEAFWSALAAGEGAVTWVKLMGEGSEARHLGAPAAEFAIQNYVSDRKLLRLMCRTDRFGLAAAQMAITESGAPEAPPERRGAFVATRKEMGPFESLFDAMRVSRDEEGQISSVLMGKNGYSQVPPLTLPAGLANGCLFAVSVLHTIRGANTNFLGSGEIGLASVGAGYQAVREGLVDWCLAGGHDAGLDRWNYADFHRLGLLSQSTEPARAVRPLDRQRDGFAIGEGGAMVVLEDLERARARGARIYAEVTGYAATCDAAGLVSPRADGTALAAAISAALDRAGLSASQVDYANAYASATQAGDRAELRALEAVFGSGRRPVVSAIKGAIGHLLAASGAVELAATVLSVAHQTAPPTLNLEEPDEECQFDCVPGTARPMPIEHAITISRGIGGQNAVMVLRRWEG